ncbi:hypothetical protein [Nesterenkonia ebinurensis]|uniref:hypothetical protein n=1 Tax=Nesterenkonia ebinurensis TaxID=2608252 RepID=UPI00123DA4C1|nr:hypothetical protein [Nesterenkonia ebinurensis]
MTLLCARIAAVLTLVSLAVLFASAGLLVQDARGLDFHGAGALAIHVFSGVLASALGVHAWVTRSGIPTAVAAFALFGLTFAQAALGSYMTLALHVVGALVVTVLAAWVAFWIFTAQKTAVPLTARTRESPT